MSRKFKNKFNAKNDEHVDVWTSVGHGNPDFGPNSVEGWGQPLTFGYQNIFRRSELSGIQPLNCNYYFYFAVLFQILLTEYLIYYKKTTKIPPNWPCICFYIKRFLWNKASKDLTPQCNCTVDSDFLTNKPGINLSKSQVQNL